MLALQSELELFRETHGAAQQLLRRVGVLVNLVRAMLACTDHLTTRSGATDLREGNIRQSVGMGNFGTAK